MLCACIRRFSAKYIELALQRTRSGLHLVSVLAGVISSQTSFAGDLDFGRYSGVSAAR